MEKTHHPVTVCTHIQKCFNICTLFWSEVNCLSKPHVFEPNEGTVRSLARGSEALGAGLQVL